MPVTALQAMMPAAKAKGAKAKSMKLKVKKKTKTKKKLKDQSSSKRGTRTFKQMKGSVLPSCAVAYAVSKYSAALETYTYNLPKTEKLKMKLVRFSLI